MYYTSAQVNVLRCSVVEYIYIYIYICHDVQSGGSITFIVNGVGGRLATAPHYMSPSNEIFRKRQ